jgi:Tfp pilus assembly protein PilF
MTRVALLVALLAALAGCSSDGRSGMPLFQSSRGEPVLVAGLRQYEEGQYNRAAMNLESALDLGLTEEESAKAHKHLAFIHCAQGREGPCRDEFRKALAIDPALELSPAESGHPVWGPIFRTTKLESNLFKLGLQQFDDGEYTASAKSLQTAIDRGLPDKERASAHKHLAFIHCVAKREQQCRDEFRKALAVDPTLTLEPAEAGHPIWGPVFRSLKASR